jgi:site-specific DNA-cytosine methylase
MLSTLKHGDRILWRNDLATFISYYGCGSIIIVDGETTTRVIEAKACLNQGHVVSMTTRALARFQSLPDSYRLPENKSLACTIIGNGVPSLMGLRIFESFGK